VSKTVLEPLYLTRRSFVLAEAITQLFKETGLRLSVRQIYYQLASRKYISLDSRKSYRAVQRLMAKLRYEGAIPYNWVVDRTRQPIDVSSWNGTTDFFETVREAYRKSLWQSQPDYVELWLEKDALSGFFSPITSKFQVRLMVGRGFSSISFLYEASMDLIQVKKPIYVYFFGDHDPSGRLIESKVIDSLQRHGVHVANFERIAILPEDIERYNLPPNPAKATDPRYRRFVEKYGEQAVELDALPPVVLRERITNCITQHLDMAEWERLKVIEEQEAQSIRAFLECFPTGQEA
jgi:hypothetical protein